MEPPQGARPARWWVCEMEDRTERSHSHPIMIELRKLPSSLAQHHLPPLRSARLLVVCRPRYTQRTLFSGFPCSIISSSASKCHYPCVDSDFIGPSTSATQASDLSRSTRITTHQSSPFSSFPRRLASFTLHGTLRLIIPKFSIPNIVPSAD